jgi:hypothetical protein
MVLPAGRGRNNGREALRLRCYFAAYFAAYFADSLALATMSAGVA